LRSTHARWRYFTHPRLSEELLFCRERWNAFLTDINQLQPVGIRRRRRTQRFDTIIALPEEAEEAAFWFARCLAWSWGYDVPKPADFESVPRSKRKLLACLPDVILMFPGYAEAKREYDRAASKLMGTN